MQPFFVLYQNAMRISDKVIEVYVHCFRKKKHFYPNGKYIIPNFGYSGEHKFNDLYGQSWFLIKSYIRLKRAYKIVVLKRFALNAKRHKIKE